jgi:hypothetical protein
MIITSFLFLSLQSPVAQAAGMPDSLIAAHVASVSSYVPHRVYRSSKKRFEDFESMLAEVA